MKTIMSLLLIILLISCKKEDRKIALTPAVDYINLNDTVLKSQHIVLDLNKDNKNDLLFYSEMVNALPHEYLEFRVVPQIESGVLANAAEPKVINRNEVIYFENNTGYNWSEDLVVLAKRVYPVNLEDSYWDGAWKEKQNKYLGVQLTKDNKKYNAWIRLSVLNDKSRMILHDAAISKDPGVNIYAGVAP